MRVSVKDAAVKLRKSEKTIWNMMRDGRLPFESEVDESMHEKFAGRNRRWVIFPDPAPVVVASVKDSLTQPESALLGSAHLGSVQESCTLPLGPIEAQEAADRKFAKAYLAGEATDS